ncbi:MAG: hypothetical protein VXW87_02375 [Pseudomonadota bacterium]|nr:hypothetical protein [Pseudomonadota bacterium]
MSKLLRSLVVLSMAPLFAGYHDGSGSEGMTGVSIGGEVFATSTFLGFAPTVTLATATGDPQNIANILGTSTINFAEGQDKAMGVGFGAALVAKMSLSDDFDAMARFSLHNSYKDAKALTTASTGMTKEGTSKSKNVILTASALAGMNGLYLGAGYQMSEYEFASINTSAASSKENMVIGMIRGESEFDADGMQLVFFGFAETNFGQKSDSDVKDYIGKYAAEAGVGSLTTASESHTIYNQIGFGVGAYFYDM